MRLATVISATVLSATVLSATVFSVAGRVFRPGAAAGRNNQKKMKFLPNLVVT